MQAARASFDRQCITEQNLPRDLKRDLLNTYKAPTSTTEDTQIEKERCIGKSKAEQNSWATCDAFD